MSEKIYVKRRKAQSALLEVAKNLNSTELALLGNPNRDLAAAIAGYQATFHYDESEDEPTMPGVDWEDGV